ncbi:MAG TPA: hypothetical protein VKC66_17925 [Xanthobacteraceae bacterium]|nr:hypothetical protein [Xanthobacteraceae bacterium]
MGASIIAGSLIAAGVYAQAATNSIPWSGSDQPALVHVDRDFGGHVQSRTTFSPGGPAVMRTGLLHRVSNFIGSLFANWSSPNAQALRVLKDAYEDPVIYYDKVISREAALDEKRRFAERWPRRTYTIRPGTLIVQCGDDSRTCTVSGTTDWAVAKNAKRSTGSANFYYAVRVGEGGLLKIAEETSKVVHGRIVSSAVPGNRRLPGNPQRAVNKTACAADGAEILRGNAVCRN